MVTATKNQVSLTQGKVLREKQKLYACRYDCEGVKMPLYHLGFDEI